MFCYAGTTFFFVDVYVAWLTHICGIIHFNPDIIRPFHYWRYSAAQMPHLFFGDVHVAWLNRICDMTYFNSGIIQTFHYWRYTAVQKRIFFWRMDALCHTHDWVLSLQECAVVWAYVPTISHVTHVNKSCHSCKWVMSHTKLSANATSCFGVLRDMTYSYFCIFDLTYSCMWHASFICVAWPICKCDWAHFMCVTSFRSWYSWASRFRCALCWYYFSPRMRDDVKSHTWMGHVTHVNQACRTYEWVMSHIWMCHGTHLSDSCHTCEWIMSHMSVRHVTDMNESCHTCEWVMSHIWMSHVTPINASCHTHE